MESAKENLRIQREAVEVIMERDERLKQGEYAWVVPSDARMLPVYLSGSLRYARPEPRPIVSTRQRRPYSRVTQTLVPLSLRTSHLDR